MITEQTIFNHTGNTFKTDDRDIQIIATFEEPLVVVLGNVISDKECEELILLSKDRVKRSRVGMKHELNDLRTSSGAFLEENENLTVTTVEKRVAQIMNIPRENGEPLHILNYLPNQEYKPHFDFFDSKNKPVTNNRISTLIMYLNDVEEGGETVFPSLNLSIKPQKGMAVYFEYFYNNQAVNELTLHGGSPVIKGEKWVATQWMRKKNYRGTF